MTEDEAKTKICPVSRNRRWDEGELKCSGSECMAWRPIIAASRDNPTRTPETGHSWNNIGGYCGLAGRP